MFSLRLNARVLSTAVFAALAVSTAQAGTLLVYKLGLNSVGGNAVSSPDGFWLGTGGFNEGNGMLEPISRSQQYEPFGPSTGASSRCPGGATQSAGDGSNPFVDPPWAGGPSTSTCNPKDVPPGP